ACLGRVATGVAAALISDTADAAPSLLNILLRNLNIAVRIFGNTGKQPGCQFAADIIFLSAAQLGPPFAYPSLRFDSPNCTDGHTPKNSHSRRRAGPPGNLPGNSRTAPEPARNPHRQQWTRRGRDARE